MSTQESKVMGGMWDEVDQLMDTIMFEPGSEVLVHLLSTQPSLSLSPQTQMLMEEALESSHTGTYDAEERRKRIQEVIDDHRGSLNKPGGEEEKGQGTSYQDPLDPEIICSPLSKVIERAQESTRGFSEIVDQSYLQSLETCDRTEQPIRIDAHALGQAASSLSRDLGSLDQLLDQVHALGQPMHPVGSVQEDKVDETRGMTEDALSILQEHLMIKHLPL
ncbi:MAG: hypothetical protein DHS80DRAFT_28961 [Piptocephalis tieghemiana]|nr:MAG: hypothetical protein DHS80DRAFT_28961 [Piptocephalis tieghemiana]